jgi:hypothetical protein
MNLDYDSLIFDPDTEALYQRWPHLRTPGPQAHNLIGTLSQQLAKLPAITTPIPKCIEELEDLVRCMILALTPEITRKIIRREFTYAFNSRLPDDGQPDRLPIQLAASPESPSFLRPSW